jgi:hypothetical protein
VFFGIVDFMKGKVCFPIAFFKMQPRKRRARAWFVFLSRAAARIVSFMIGKVRFSMNATIFSKAIFKDLEAGSLRLRDDSASRSLKIAFENIVAFIEKRTFPIIKLTILAAARLKNTNHARARRFRGCILKNAIGKQTFPFIKSTIPKNTLGTFDEIRENQPIRPNCRRKTTYQTSCFSACLSLKPQKRSDS